MRELTDQELFDNAARGIRRQGCRAAVLPSHETCSVLLHDGRRCALGHSVTDAKPGDTETPQWQKLAARPVGSDLQEAHDVWLATCSRESWHARMLAIAAQYKLDPSALTEELPT